MSSYHSLDIFMGVLCPQLRSETFPEKEITQGMHFASRAFLHDERDKVNKRGW